MGPANSFTHKTLAALCAVIMAFTTVFTRVAHAENEILINPIVVTGMGNYLGKNLHVLYVIGATQGLMTDDRQFRVEKVLAQTSVVIGGDQLAVLGQKIIVNDVRKPAVLFVVSSDANFSWNYNSLSKAVVVRKLLWPQFGTFMRNNPGAPIRFDINFGLIP